MLSNRLVLGMLDQQRLVLGKEGLLRRRREGRRSLTRPHVYGVGPGVLWRGPWCARPSWAGRDAAGVAGRLGAGLVASFPARLLR
jgi:hypothetical protein